MTAGKLQVVPLGGLGEFGMNCMALRWGDDIIVIDAGLMFPESELLGVDIVVPDITYLLENRDKVRAILLTHGHEDHIGGLPWILSELNIPVYGTEFTLALVEGKLEEHGLLDSAQLNEIAPNERFRIGPFLIHPLRVTHSLVDCVALAIHTPLGVVIHSGDFKVDPTPTDGNLFDLHQFAEYGKERVLLLLQDSTNVERPGYTPSERAVRPRFEEIFTRSKRRLFVFDSPHQARRRNGLRTRAQACPGRPIDERSHGDRSRPRLSDDSGRNGNPPRTDSGFCARKSLCADQRHAGRADVGAVAGGGGQSQARQD